MKKNQINMTKTPVSYKYILSQTDLSAWEKLAYIIIDQEQPCDLDTICRQLYLSIESVKMVVAQLLSKGLIVEAKLAKDFFYPAFCLRSEKKKQEEKKEKVTISEKDKDLLLLIKKLEEFYKQRGVSYRLSKKGRKYLGHAVTYLNKTWEARERFDELKEFRTKEELYVSYIEFTFKNLDDSELNHVKRLVFAANKSAWRAQLKSTFIRFTPHLLLDFSSGEKFIGVPRNEIPNNPKAKGHWTTVDTFLLKKWKTKNYPVCKQVLYALERVIVYHLFRKEQALDLIKIHEKYVKEYKTAEMRGKLDNLVEYIKENKRRSNICHGCTKAKDCTSAKSGALITKCESKTTS